MRTGGGLHRPKGVTGAAFVALMALAPQPALAACNAEAAIDFAMEMDSFRWVEPIVEEFESTEGPGTRETFAVNPDRLREDVQYCVSNYCVSSIELRLPARHGRLFFFTWGGSSFPDANESSAVFSDRLTG